MTYWRDKKVLVTGAGGFIGSHLTEALLKEGAEVTAFIRYTSENSLGWLAEHHSNDSIRFLYGDLNNPETVRGAVRNQEVVFNLAALIGIPYSYVNPEECVSNNLSSTLNVLAAARDLGVERVVQTSTSEVYGTAQYAPMDEKHPKQPQSPYSASKIACDAVALSYNNSFDLSVSIVRPFNTFGPRQSTRAVIPTIITQAISGSKIKLGSGHTTRDFLYVEDTAKGFMAIGESNNTIGKEVNIGTGVEISIDDLAKLICSLIDGNLEFEVDSNRIRPENSEVGRLLCNADLAGELTGWKHDVSLEEGLRRTIEWFKTHGTQRDYGSYRV